MADRTYFYKLVFEQGYLQDVEEASEDAFGIRTGDLDNAEKEAVDQILRLLTPKAGWAQVEIWRDDWLSELTTYPDQVPRSIRTLADLLGSAQVWRRNENFNRQVPEEGMLLLSQMLVRDAKALWDSICASGVIIYEDGTAVIDLTATSGNTGVGVSGAEALVFADNQNESSYGIRPEFSTEKLFKELNG